MSEAVARQPRKCRRCGEDHEIFACPHVKAIEFEFGYVDGAPGEPSIRRFEFLTPSDLVARRAEPAPDGSPDYPRKGQR